MYRKLSIVIFTFVVIFLQFQPILANGRSLGVNKRYCTGENNKIFNGRVKHDQNGSPLIFVEVDPAFAVKMNKERGTSLDLPVTPIYDLSIKISPDINDYCIPQWDENDNLVGPIIPPETFPYKVALMLEGEEIASSYQLERVDREYGTNWGEYEWKVKGWPKGIVPAEKLENLIAKIQTGKADIKVVVNPAEPDVTKRDQTGASFELCVPVYGTGKHTVTMARGASSRLSVSRLLDKANLDMLYGFKEIEPYKKYIDQFGFTVDLVYYQDVWIMNDFIVPLEKAYGNKQKMIPQTIQDEFLKRGFVFESCVSDTNILYSNFLPRGLGGIAILSGGGLIISPNTSSEVTMHEFSHTFAGLNDEYVYANASLGNAAGIFTNCSTLPSRDYSYMGKLYGSTFLKGCAFNWSNFATRVADRVPFYRPSLNSLMNNSSLEPAGFNVVSCGYIMEAIKGGDARSYFPECNGMEGIVDRGIVAVAENTEENIPITNLAQNSQNFGQQTASALSAFDRAFDSTSLTALALPVLTLKEGTQVKVRVQATNQPPAEFEQVLKGEKVKTFSSKCLDGTGQKVFKDSPDKYSSPREKCFQGIADVTTLYEKRTALEESIKVIKKFVDSLTLSREETKRLTSLNNTSFVIIPSGASADRTYEHANNIQMKCVAPPNSPSNVFGSATLIGNITPNKGKVYEENSPKITAMVKVEKQKIDKSYQDYLKEDAKDRGTVTFSTTSRLSALNKILSSNFVLITANAFAKHHQSVKEAGNDISISITLNTGQTEKKKQCTSSGWLVETALSAAGVTGSFFESKVTIDGKTFDPECIPEEFLLKVLQDVVVKNLNYFVNLKTEYETSLKTVNKQISTLESAKYYCEDATTLTSTSQPLPPPPPDNLSGSGETADFQSEQDPSLGGFIVETFLPDGTIEGDYYGFSDTPTEIGLENPEEQFFLPVEPEVPYFYPASSAPQPPPPPSDTPPSGFAPLVRCFNSVEHPCDFNDLMTLINTVIRFILFVLAVPIAAIMFAYAGFMLVTSGGSTEARGKAKKIFTSAVFGLVIAAGAWLIVRTILSILGYDGAWIGFSIL